MTYSAPALLAIAATLFVNAPAFAAPTTINGSVEIADIGRDAVEMSQTREVLPTVSDLFVAYPELAKERGVTGTTIVAVTLDDHNKLVGASIYKSSGNRFMDTWAKYAVRSASFQSGTVAGKPVGGEYSIRVDFGNDR